MNQEDWGEDLVLDGRRDLSRSPNLTRRLNELRFVSYRFLQRQPRLSPAEAWSFFKLLDLDDARRR